MKNQILFFFLILTSCTPLVKPLPTQAIIESEKNPTPSNTPTILPALLIDPFRVSTPINTPHPTPAIQFQSQTPIAKDSYSYVYDERVKGFENTLLFHIQIIEVGLELQGNDRYIVVAEGKLTNVSDKPIVVQKTLGTGLFFPIDVSWNFFHNEEELNFHIQYVDLFYSFTQDDFVVLQPNEFQKYNLVFALPLKSIVDVILSGKKITLIASYENYMVEYFSGDYYDRKYIDVNAWVGSVQSNSVEYIFP